MSVSEQDVKDLLKRYPNPKGVSSIAYHIPCSQRNLEIVDGMSKFVGPISKRWRGPRLGNRSFAQDLPRKYAERVSIYLRGRDESKYNAFMNEEPKKAEEPPKPNVDEMRIANIKSMSVGAMNYLMVNAKHVHGVVVLPEYVYENVFASLKSIAYRD